MQITEQYHHNTSHRFRIIIAVLVVFGLGVVSGMYLNIRSQLTNADGTVNISNVLNLYSKTRSEDVSFDQFWDVWDKIKEKYVGHDVSDVQLFYGALSGLVAGLDDPYSTYFSPTKAQEFARDLSGEFEGIGAEIGIRDKQLVVVAPLPESPAEKAGLHTGDIILSIDDQETYGMTLEEAIGMIRGEKGTTVVLTITRNGFEGATKISIVRNRITVPSVIWKSLDDGTAYVRIGQFNEQTWSEFDKAIREIMVATPRGIVLDLRSNPGGYLDTSVAVASEWVDTGVIVSEEFGDEKKNEYQSQGKHRFKGIPTVVLVDEGTASGSEIVAGALQDYGVATIVGNQTFGKGSVQDFEVLPDGSALKLTVAKWFTPKHRAIDKAGITPDVIVDPMFSTSTPNGEDEQTTDVVVVDHGLLRAHEILTQSL